MILIEILGRIECLRAELNEILEVCTDLTDQEVVIKSVMLDNALNEYNELSGKINTDADVELVAL